MEEVVRETQDLGGQIETPTLSLAVLLPAHRAVEALRSHTNFPLCCSLSPQAWRHRAKQLGTETSETVKQKKPSRFIS